MLWSRLHIIAWLICVPASIFAQTANFEDDFTDQDISDWSGTTADFTFKIESNNVLLQQNATAAGTSFLSIPSTEAVGYWEFFIRLDGFSPSDGNKAEIFLMSDNADLTSNVNGYMLQAGENLSGDVFRLFRITNGAKDGEILAGTTDISSGGDFRVKVTRDATGNWTLEAATGYTGILVGEATGTDNTYTTASHFGFVTTYTSTRTDRFAFDFKIDIPPITVTDVNLVNDTEIDIVFNQAYDPASVQTTDFTLQPNSINPQSFSTLSADSLRISFISPLPGGIYSLNISDLNDLSGSTTLTDTTFQVVVYDDFSSGDIIINEFMKDPPIGASEYIEIKNVSGKYLNLKDWRIGDDRSLTTISFADTPLLPNEYAVISADTSSLNGYYGSVNYILASLPALNNGEDGIRLLDSSGAIADSLFYNADWGGVDVAVERRDPSVSSIYKENWGDSPSPDLGTPGYSNLIEPDSSPAQLTEINLLNRSQLQLVYSERIQESPTTLTANYSLQADNITDPGVIIEAITYTEPNSVLLQLSDDLPSEPEGTTYELTIENQTDLFGNVSRTISRSLFIIDYALADSGQVFITEFMYDPPDGFTDFIELYNPTDSAYNLQNWSFNDNSGVRRSLTDQQHSLLPHSRIVLAPDSTILSSFPDIEIIVMGSAFANLNSTTPDDIVIRNAVGTLIDSLTYDNTWGGDKVSLERRSIAVSSKYIENWGASPSSQLATPGAGNLLADDLNAPEISELIVLNDSSIQVLFSERIQKTAAENTSNYALHGPSELNGQIPAISSVTFFEPDTVIIQFEAALPKQNTGTTYELMIKDQLDIFGNSTATLFDSFFLIEIQYADSGDIVINEFMYDPAMDYSEFIELHNKSTKNIDLNGWTLNDNTGSRRKIINKTSELVQGSYMVLLPDSTLFRQFPDKNLIVLGTAFPSLNNGSDDIVIRDQNGSLIDSLTYTSDWGGDRVSLERLDSEAPSSFAENWADSPSIDKATPGSSNEVSPDTEAPFITQGYTNGLKVLGIKYNERVSSDFATDPSNYTISPAIGISDIVQTKGHEISIVLSSAMTDGTVYTVTVQEQADIFGNLQTNSTVQIEYTEFTTALPGDVIINEILYRRSTGDSPEFIELYNQSDQNFDLSNWTISDASNSATLPSETQLRSGEYLILTDTESFTMNKIESAGIINGAFIYLPRFPSLNDKEDVVVIKSESGMVIDSLNYKNSWGGNTPGISLERKDPLSASNDLNNWADNTTESGHTAGVENSIYEPDQVPPQIVFAKTIGNDRLSLEFSEFVVPFNATLTVNGSTLSIYDYDPDNANKIIAGPATVNFGDAMVLSVSDMEDFRGNISKELNIEVSQPLTPASVVINEIMFDPLADSEDNLPDQTEYIELYNRSDYAISLEGIFLHDAPDEDNEIRPIEPVTTSHKWIPSREYFLIYADDQAEDFNDSRLAEYFEISDSSEKFKIRVDRSSLSLGSTEDAIYLSDSTGTAIDSVFYSEDWHNPNLFDTDGIALERIDPNGPSNDDSNWSSTTRVNGGSPAEQNSIFQLSGSAPEKTGLSFSPNPFSPDNDGFEDNLFINYKLDESDYLLRVRIFDRYGRLVRYLANGTPAGYEGSLIWDGLTDDQKKNRVGIYIVLFEAFNSTNGRNKTFKETVVLARQF